MFFKKKDDIHDTSVTDCAEKAKIKDEKFKVKNPEKKKINPKVVFRVGVIVIVILSVLGIKGYFEMKKRDIGLVLYKNTHTSFASQKLINLILNK